MGTLADLRVTLVLETGHDVFGRGGPLYLHLFLVGAVYEGQEIECIFRNGALFLELFGCLYNVIIYCQLVPGVNYTLAGMLLRMLGHAT